MLILKRFCLVTMMLNRTAGGWHASRWSREILLLLIISDGRRLTVKSFRAIECELSTKSILLKNQFICSKFYIYFLLCFHVFSPSLSRKTFNKQVVDVPEDLLEMWVYFGFYKDITMFLLIVILGICSCSDDESHREFRKACQPCLFNFSLNNKQITIVVRYSLSLS